MTDPLEALERQRAEILKQIQELGDMRRAASSNIICPVGNLPAVARSRAIQVMGPISPSRARSRARPRLVSLAPARR